MRSAVALLTVTFLACGTDGDDEPATDVPVAAHTVAEAPAPDSNPQPPIETPQRQREAVEEHAPLPTRSALVLNESGTPSISGDLEGVRLDLYHIDGEWTLFTARGTVDGVTVPDSGYRVTPVVVDLGDSLYVGFYVTDRSSTEIVAARRTTVHRVPPTPGDSGAEEMSATALLYADSLARCRHNYETWRMLAGALQERLIEALQERTGG